MASEGQPIEFRFPIEGKDENWSFANQPPLTSPDMNNVRPFDVLGKRMRGGQRPGLDKLFAQQIGGTSAQIDCLLQITITEQT